MVLNRTPFPYHHTCPRAGSCLFPPLLPLLPSNVWLATAAWAWKPSGLSSTIYTKSLLFLCRVWLSPLASVGGEYRDDVIFAFPGRVEQRRYLHGQEPHPHWATSTTLRLPFLASGPHSRCRMTTPAGLALCSCLSSIYDIKVWISSSLGRILMPFSLWWYKT